jgi:pSer/pThr/pTyr-binding forkhead associated (FHA) protein
MEKKFLVGRASNADLRIPKKHDAVGKRHLELTDLGGGRVRIEDLHSTNGTFLRIAGKWERLATPRTIAADAEIMLGDFRTTPKALLALAAPPPEKSEITNLKSEIPAEEPVRKRPRLRRNEFGEIVRE